MSGAFKAFLTMTVPLSEPLRVLVRLTKVTPPPATIPSERAARVADTASSTRYFFSSISGSVAPPTLMTATLPERAALRFSNSPLS